MVNSLLLGFLVFSLASIGLISAHAEQFTVEVPFDYGDNGCTEFVDGEWKLYQCYMEETHFPADPPSNPDNLSTETDDGCLEDYDRDHTTEECKLTTVIEAEALQECYDDIHCPVGFWETEDGEIVNNQDKIDLEDKATPTVGDGIPDGVFMCGRDIALYQDGTTYETPTESWIDRDGKFHIRVEIDGSLKAINLSNYPEIKADRMAAQECIAQHALKIREAIDQRLTVTNADDIFFDHKDIAQFIPPISAERVNAEANAETDNNKSIKDLICLTNSPYSLETKKYYGCEKDYGVSDESLKTEIGNTFSPEMAAKIKQFNDDGGAEMASDIHTALINEQLAALRAQLESLK